MISSRFSGWFPAANYTSFADDPWRNIQIFILPSIALGAALAAITMRMTRSALLEILHREYIVTARAKGLNNQTVVMRHALKNALIPVADTVWSLPVSEFKSYTQDVDRARELLAEAGLEDGFDLVMKVSPQYAFDLGLHGDDLAGALLGVGSTYRALGEHQHSIARLRQGVKEFPSNRAMEVFLAMALYNAEDHREAMERLLRIIADTSEDVSIRRYSHAITFYADKLDENW